MFGMDNPGQVIPQLRQYAAEGRLELAEVIAAELVEVLLAKKKRDIDEQKWLVEAARLAANVFEQRGKTKHSWAAVQTLHKQQKVLKTMLTKAEDAEGVQQIIANGPNDHIQAARSAAGCKKLPKALKHANKADKMVGGHLGAKIVAAQSHILAKGNMKGASSAILALIGQLEKSGSVIRTGDGYQIAPEGQSPTDLTWLLSSLKYWLNDDFNMPPKAAEPLRKCIAELERQIAAIEAGEQAANAKLQSAVEKLVPAVDYHSYSRS
ncbi:MAG TPA: hypothetical protein EYQ53_00550 [Candidatus Poseidoniales archaeon]|jgi:hypothetical protein|nr:MAG: hypothetical protein CXT69_05955 [Euryarchaeota archaeon]HIG02864.1 hypothetical protein [Candidatus Poseidoniales archaeon]HIK77848.1 hypothetical protein [Candidatus Poseidoniales archaeon]